MAGQQHPVAQRFLGPRHQKCHFPRHHLTPHTHREQLARHGSVRKPPQRIIQHPPPPEANRRQFVNPLGNQPMPGQRIIQGNTGRAIQTVRHERQRQGLLTPHWANHINPALQGNQNPLLQPLSDLVIRTLIVCQQRQQRPMVKRHSTKIGKTALQHQKFPFLQI